MFCFAQQTVEFIKKASVCFAQAACQQMTIPAFGLAPEAGVLLR